MSWLEIIANRKIEEAMEAGAFEDLEGQGQPLDLEYDPRTPAELRALHRLLKQSGFLPDWIALEKEVRQGLAAWRGECGAFAAQWEQLRDRAQREGDHGAMVDRRRDAFLFRAVEQLRLLDRTIERFNLIVPVLRRQRARIAVGEEAERLAGRWPRLTPAIGEEAWRAAYRKKAAAPSRLSNHDYVRRYGIR